MSQWEKALNEATNQATTSEEFTRAGNKALLGSALMQQQFGDLIGRYLSTLNVPSRTEVVGLAERLGAIEAWLQRISHQIDSLEGAARSGARPGPPRTKRSTASKKGEVSS